MIGSPCSHGANASSHGGQVAQSVEQRTENPCVECSIHSLPTKKHRKSREFRDRFCCGLLLHGQNMGIWRIADRFTSPAKDADHFRIWENPVEWRKWPT